MIDSHLLTNFTLFNRHQMRFHFEPENSLLKLQSFESNYTSVIQDRDENLKMTKMPVSS